MDRLLSISEAALELSELLGWEVTPRRLTALFYDRRLPSDLTSIIGGRRLIQQVHLNKIAQKLTDLSTQGTEGGNHD